MNDGLISTAQKQFLDLFSNCRKGELGEVDAEEDQEQEGRDEL